MPPQTAELRFKLDSLPEMPQRTLSGQPIKPKVIAALLASHDTYKRANAAFDRLVNAVRAHPSNPPAASGGKQKR